MLKILSCVLALSLVGCTTVQLGQVDATIQKSAPAVCKAISVAYNGYLASGHGSIKDKQVVQTAYEATTGICASPSTATATDLAILAGRLGILVNSLRKAKAHA